MIVPSRWFITGTDTNVGKSVVTACLATAAASRASTIAAKPVESGVTGGTHGEDASLLGLAAGHLPMNHTALHAPVSPHRAALDAGIALEPAAITRFIENLDAEVVLVEGVGGWRVPIWTGQDPLWVADLARATGGRVLLVAADRLGVLNHTLLTLEAIARDGLVAAGVILNRGVGTPESSVPSNHRDLDLLVDVPIAVCDRIDPLDPDSRLRMGTALWEALT